jgi:hypothetical protein
MSSGYAKEELSDDQIRADFALLDENQSSTIGFIEVCISIYIHKYIYDVHVCTDVIYTCIYIVIT